MSVKVTTANNKLELNSFYLHLKSDVSTHHGSRGTGNSWWAWWARRAWLGNHLNLSTIEMTGLKQEQKANLTYVIPTDDGLVKGEC